MSERATNTEEWPGAGSLRESIPDGWYTRAEAAAKIGRHYDRLRAWHRDGTFVPTAYVERGKLRVWLYSEEDIEALKKIVAHKHPGRKPNPPVPEPN